jgi:D-alanyl-D-alanine carboxypeptidase
MWWSLLATPDEEGTLRRRLTPLRDRLRGKTGTIAGVNALSGIIAMPNGRYRYFSVVVNHHTGEGTVGLIDAIVERAAM